MGNKGYLCRGKRIIDLYVGLPLNIHFASREDAKLCCNLLNEKQKTIDCLNDNITRIDKWHTERYGLSIIETRRLEKKEERKSIR